MAEHAMDWLFYVVFLAQVLLISLVLPRKVLDRLRFVVETYPPAQYPRLYPVTMDKVERAQRSYRGLNLFALAVGLALFALGLGRPGLIDWDNEIVLMAYMILQFSPLLIALSAGFTYFNLKRDLSAPTTRSAELRPRRLLDYISPAEISLAAVAYVAFVGLILYVGRFDYPWFGGNVNIVVMTLVNLFFAFIIINSLYGKKKDPFQAHEDRARQIEITIRTVVWTSILATIFIAMNIGLGAFELGQLKPIAFSLYIQALALLSFRAYSIDGVNFEVYREEPVAA